MSMIDEYDAIVKVALHQRRGEGGHQIDAQGLPPGGSPVRGADGERYDIGMEKYFELSAKSPLNNGGKYRARIISVEQFGPAAAVVLAEDGCWGAVSFVDIFSLNRTTDGWKIVNKTFAHTAGVIPGD
ncbi:MAG TPA: nuclear transport factor 2 family protein [Roseiarcus sp.]|jgi:hypothetical protein|nr:nuclear transport factor 2 family protein [Roseiarcus sp.]